MFKGERDVLQTGLVDRYHLIKKLGQGGMATVYLAWDTSLERNVAIKVIDEKQIDKESVERFLREARIISNLNHPNIVQIYDIVHWENTHFIVMEYVSGQSLHDLIEKQPFKMEKEIISFGMQICSGLAHAHDKGIIHRDIKPHNILCTTSGEYKIADFGISKTIDATKMTLTGMVMGSVHYISPEQATGQPVRPSSDIYSLGIVLYEVVTGNVPFDADSLVAIALKHVNQPIPDWKGTKVKVSPACKQLIFKSLEKDPEQRYQTAREVILEFEQISNEGQQVTSAKKRNGDFPFSRLFFYFSISIVLLVGVFSIYYWFNLTSTTSVDRMLKSGITKKEQNGTYPWWKELPKKHEEQSYIFHNRRITGIDGEYDVRLDLGDLPTTTFYYNIYIVDTYSSRLILSDQIVHYQRSMQSTLTPVHFHVSIPEELLPNKGIAKIELYWKNDPADNKERNVVAEESLLQQWGNAPAS